VAKDGGDGVGPTDENRPNDAAELDDGPDPGATASADDVRGDEPWDDEPDADGAFGTSQHEGGESDYGTAVDGGDPDDADDPEDDGVVATDVDFVWESRLGETRLETVHLPLFASIVRTVRVHRTVNLATHPELEAAVRSGTLHHLDSGEELALPYLLHVPDRRILAVVVPETLRHEALRARAEFAGQLAADTLEPIPPYVLDAGLIVGTEELAELLDAPAVGRPLSAEGAAVAARAGQLAVEESRVAGWEAELDGRERMLDLRESELDAREAALDMREDELAAGEDELLARARDLDDRLEDAIRAGRLPESLEDPDADLEAPTDASGAHPVPRLRPGDSERAPSIDDVELVDEEAEAVVAELDEVVRDSVRAGGRGDREGDQAPASGGEADTASGGDAAAATAEDPGDDGGDEPRPDSDPARSDGDKAKA